ncbi:MAG: alpha/beta hydrolase [Candidatus Latescibacteria bacterium]|nr:alpha/beta hydrolase [Candidatus Latescibacterota bacterium]
MTPEIKEHRIDSRRYGYIDEGSGNAVVLLHGHFIAEGQWDPQIPALVDAGYRVICPHRAGMGASDPSDFMSDAGDADDTFLLLGSLGVRECVAVGHSAGTAHARQMLLSRSGRVSGIVFADGLFYLSGASSRLGTERYSPGTLKAYEKNRAVLEANDLPWYYPSDYNVSLLEEWNAWVRRHPNAREELQRRDDPRNVHFGPERTCEVPMLVIASGWGKIRPGDPEEIALRNRLPGPDAEVVVLTECGHYVQLEQAEAFNRALLDFLARVYQ